MTEYDFHRFVDDDHIMVRSSKKLSFHLMFELNDNECDHTHTISAYTKRYPTDADCVCVSDDDPECVCNWNFELVSNSHSAKRCIEDMMDKINKVVGCERCNRSHVQYQDFTQCPTCFLQRVAERDMPVVNTCPVCYEDHKENSTHQFKCKHLMCEWCYQKMPAPKRCPLCRSEE